MLFQVVDHPEALLVVLEPVGVYLLQDRLTGMPEGGGPEVVPEGHGLGEVLIEPEGPGDGAGYLAYFKHVGEACAVVVPLGREEHLGLVLEAAEGL